MPHVSPDKSQNRKVIQMNLNYELFKIPLVTENAPSSCPSASKNEAAYSIPCEMIFPYEQKAFVIITHGFGSSKESQTAQMMLKDLSEKGFGAIAYDLPAHGTGQALDTPLTLKNCMASLSSVESYIAERFLFPRIYYFSSSFGAYITLTSLAKSKHLGDKAFLRSTAVNMPELFTKDPDPAIIKELETNGSYLLDKAGPAPVKITKQFFDDLAANDLFAAASQIPFDDVEVMMVHGEKDMVIDPDAAVRFSRENNVPLTMFSGEDHTLSTYPDSPGKVSEAAIAFFDDEIIDY